MYILAAWLDYMFALRVQYLKTCYLGSFFMLIHKCTCPLSLLESWVTVKTFFFFFVQLFTCDDQFVEHSGGQMLDLTLQPLLTWWGASPDFSPPIACGVFCASSHWLDRTWCPRIPGGENQEGALPGQAGSDWKPGCSVGESRPRGLPCHSRHFQPRSVEHGTRGLVSVISWWDNDVSAEATLQKQHPHYSV